MLQSKNQTICFAQLLTLDEDQVDVSNVQDPARDYNYYTHAIPINSSHNNMKTKTLWQSKLLDSKSANDHLQKILHIVDRVQRR